MNILPTEINEIRAKLLVAELSELPDWLRGIGMPSDGYGLKPHEWIFKALPTENRATAVAALTAEVSKLLRKAIDVVAVQNRQDHLRYELLENLFYLCADLGQPAHFEQLLWGIYDRQKQVEKPFDDRIEIKTALRSALVRNQASACHTTFWRTMLETSLRRRDDPNVKLDSIVGGSMDSGFRGILFMRDWAAPGEPVWEHLGYALRMMSDFGKPLENRRAWFRNLLLSTYSAWFADRYADVHWHSELIEQADQHRWEKWAVECLPRCCFKLPNGNYNLWEHLFQACAGALELVMVRELCGGAVVEVACEWNDTECLEELSGFFEAWRLRNPYSSEESSKAMAIEAANDLLSKHPVSSPQHARFSCIRTQAGRLAGIAAEGEMHLF